MKTDFGMDPMTRPDPTEGGLGESPLEIHMRAFAKAAGLKGANPKAMAAALHAFIGECKDTSYDSGGGDDEAAEGEAG